MRLRRSEPGVRGRAVCAPEKKKRRAPEDAPLETCRCEVHETGAEAGTFQKSRASRA